MRKNSGKTIKNNSTNISESANWKTASIVQLSEGENKGKDRITITMHCPKCNGEVPVSIVVPKITSRILYIHFPGRGKCLDCKKFVKVEVPRKPTIRWKELAEAEIEKVRWEDEHRYIQQGSAPSVKRGRRKGLTASQKDDFRQMKYASILRKAS